MLFGSYEYWKWKKELSESTPEIEVHEIDDPVVGWRFGYLLGIGFDPETALLLAESSEVDLRKAEDLVKRGCSLETAVGILL